ncbi:plasma membrane calcium [Entomophthora muscae]|uniref:Plasma membrane calcium n=1 Tax=Entomophthora muscae TaxID=34485 RepID=A0ACC2TNW5_9FUNG|nr:plasma membrane calcium [Entomophthora muscae]
MPTERTPLISGSQSEGTSNPFSLDAQTLADLIDPKSPEKLQELGGVEGILKALKVDAKIGLSGDELSELSTQQSSYSCSSRVEVFGKNVLPETQQRSLWSLVWEAYQDRTLILLTIAALVSLAVGLYEDSLKDPATEARVGWVEGVAIIVAVLVVIFHQRHQ